MATLQVFVFAAALLVASLLAILVWVQAMRFGGTVVANRRSGQESLIPSARRSCSSCGAPLSGCLANTGAGASAGA